MNNKGHIYQKKKIVFSVVLAVLMLLPSTAIGNNYPDFPGAPAPTDTDSDDCDSVEVMVGEIISPPSNGMTGTYDVTVNFTAVEIIINGIRDYDENEPWVEHELSPDNNGTPHVHFYTSCDEEYMYVAFENQTDGILAGELFIDKNMNNTWDGPSEDSFFTIDYLGSNNDTVKDHNGHEVPNSIVGWGNQTFVEIKIPKVNWSICNDWAYRVISTPVGDCFCGSWNPSWGNNSAPSTPPDNEFLTFTCDYNGEYSCPCGVGFKALAGIYEIVPGDYVTIYETDFENSSNVSNEWIAYSLDGNPDTWELSEDRSHSSSHGYHCTNNTTYFGDAYDILQMKNSLDLSDVNNVSFSFWHWCEGDTYTSNNSEQIVDYGDVELYTYIESNWSWISLSDLGISNLYYDNGWVKAEIDIEISKLYPLNGENISGDTLLTSQAKFRFVWKSDPQ
jgi:hypothetical protein